MTGPGPSTAWATGKRKGPAEHARAIEAIGISRNGSSICWIANTDDNGDDDHSVDLDLDAGAVLDGRAIRYARHRRLAATHPDQGLKLS